MAAAATPFTGFSSAALEFLRGLAEHNDREWFRSRKTVYETELQIPLNRLVVQTTERFRRARVPLRADPKRSVFRIYRDTRFSPVASSTLTSSFCASAAKLTDAVSRYLEPVRASRRTIALSRLAHIGKVAKTSRLA